MPTIKNRKFETFNDGVVDIYSVKGREIEEIKLTNVRFGLKTVGVTRFYRAKVASDTVDKLIAIPLNVSVQRSDILQLGNVQYKILQIQEKRETVPPSLYLSLERSNVTYRKAGTENGE